MAQYALCCRYEHSAFLMNIAFSFFGSSNAVQLLGSNGCDYGASSEAKTCPTSCHGTATTDLCRSSPWSAHGRSGWVRVGDMTGRSIFPNFRIIEEWLYSHALVRVTVGCATQPYL